MKIAAPAYCKDGVFNVMPALSRHHLTRLELRILT